MLKRIFQRTALALCLSGIAQPLVNAPAETWFSAALRQGIEWHKSQAALTRLSEQPDAIGLQSILQAWVREFPKRVKMESYGHSRAGRNLYLLRILPQDPLTGEWLSKGPSAWVVPPFGAAHDPGQLLKEIQNWLRDPSLSVPFQICIPILPDPDSWLDGKSTVCFERNFPSEWTPWCEAGLNPGAAPLSEPETRQLVRLRMRSHASLGLIRWNPKGHDSMFAGPGSLALYSREVWRMPSLQSAAQRGALKGALLKLDAQRDRLQAEVIGVERLSSRLWAVDLSLTNLGSCEVFGLGAGLKARWSGASARALAVAGNGTLHYELQDLGTPVAAPGVGRTLRHRWIIECEPTAVIEVVYEHARLTDLVVSIPLPKDLPMPR